MPNIDFRHLPDVYGEGTIFAFSGIDGQTHVASEFVATFSAEHYGLIFHTPKRRTLQITLPNAISANTSVATGDVLWIDCGETPLILTWSVWHTLVGKMPFDTTISLANEHETSPATTERIITETARDAVVLVRSGDCFAVAFGNTVDTAIARAEKALTQNIERVVATRLLWYDKFDKPLNNQRLRLANKCLSVMKVNTLAPEATFQDYWSTPDRVPHRNLWLWDSVFHALAMTQVDPTLAWYFLKSVLDMQADDGMIPISGSADGGRAPGMTQPPLLAWGIWENYRVTQNRAQLQYALPRLDAYLRWNLENRDSNGNHLLEWDIEEDELCRSGESGMDNSPRFDEALLVDAVDFSTFQAHDMLMLSKIADELGQVEQSAFWENEAQVMSQQIYDQLWSNELNIYVDIPAQADVTISPVAASSGFLPLMLPDIPSEHVEKLVQTLQDPSQFWSPFPVPSVALNHATWSTDMWRESTWLNFNYLIMLGLQRRGQHTVAEALRDQTLALVGHYYNRYGVLFEFYDARDERQPYALDRKGPYQPPYDFRKKYHTIRDFHWTAATVLLMLLDSEKTDAVVG